MLKKLLISAAAIATLGGAAQAATLTVHNIAAATVTVFQYDDAGNQLDGFDLAAGASHTWNYDGKITISNEYAWFNFTPHDINNIPKGDAPLKYVVDGWNEGITVRNG